MNKFAEHFNIRERLPLELLCKIFRDLQEDEKGSYSLEAAGVEEDEKVPGRIPGHAWRTAREVCRFWQKTIDSYRYLWTTIDIERNEGALKWVELCIARSGHLDLKIQFFAAQHLHQVCNMLLPFRGRIREIGIYNARTIRELGSLQELFDEPLRRLVELRIKFAWNADDENAPRFVLEELIDIEAQNVPALRSLDLRGVFLPWFSEILPQLHRLSLWGWSVDEETWDLHCDVCLEDFLDILASCQSLERLTLMLDNTMSHIVYSPEDEFEKVVLPKLQYFCMRMSHNDPDLPKVISHICFPEDCIIQLSTNAPSPSEAGAGLLLPNDPDNVPILYTANRACWNGPMGFECRGPVGSNAREGQLRIETSAPRELDGTDGSVMLTDFCDYLAHAPLRVLLLRWPLGDAGQYRHVFETFPELEQLSVECSEQVASRALLNAFVSEATSEIVLPRLRTLRIVRHGKNLAIDLAKIRRERSRRLRLLEAAQRI